MINKAETEEEIIMKTRLSVLICTDKLSFLKKLSLLASLSAYLLILLVFPMPIFGAESKITAETGDANASDYFGGAVSIFDDYAIVGAEGDNQSKGAAYLFRRIGETWSLQSKITADDGVTSDKFGTDVSVSGAYAVIGASYDDDKAANSGSAYIFKRETYGWIQHSKITASDGAANDFFGSAAAVAGADELSQYAIVGSPYDDDKGTDSGSAYIYQRIGSSWVQQKKLLASDGETGDFFGTSVSLCGQGTEWYAIAGAHLKKDSQTRKSFGAAYIFKLESGTWIQKDKLTAGTYGAEGDYFGRSVSLSVSGTGCYAIVGAYGTSTNTGAAYIFALENSAWMLKQRLTADYPTPYDYFGRAVSVSVDYAVIGAYGDDAKQTNAGAVYVFKRNTGNLWTQISKKTASDGAAGDFLGRSVAVSGYYTVAGAPANLTNTGAAFIWHVDDNAVNLKLPPKIYDLRDQSVPKNQSAVIPFTVYDSDTLPANVSVSAVSGNTALIPAVPVSCTGTDCKLTVTPTANQIGKAQITVSAKDPDNPAVSASFILSVNDPPVISNLPETATTNENVSTSPISFKISDSATPVSSLSLSATSSDTAIVPNANIVFSTPDYAGNCTLTITPAQNKTGTVKITVALTDTDKDTTVKTLTLSIKGAPKIEGLTDRTSKEDEQVYVNFIISDVAGPENLTVSYSWMSTDMSEANIVLSKISTDSRRLTITPPKNEFGDAYITVTAKNADGATAKKTFKLEVAAVNDPPTISGPQTTPLMNQDTPKSFVFTVGDVDNKVSSLTLSAESGDETRVPNDGKSLLFSGTGTERTLTIIPATGAHGAPDITVTVSDGAAETQTKFTLTINAKPTISTPAAQSIDEDATKDFNLTLNDPDDDENTLTVSAVSDNPTLFPAGAAHLTVTGTGAARILRVKPAANQVGTAEITLTVKDSKEAYSESRFFLTVNPVNDPPAISDISPQQTAEDTWSPKIPIRISDPEGGMLTVSVAPLDTALIPYDKDHVHLGDFASHTDYSIWSEPGKSVTVNLQLLPATDRIGTTGIRVTVKDNGTPVGQAQTQFVFTVNNENDPPVISDIASQQTNEDTKKDIAFTATDPEGGTLTVTARSNDQNLVPDANITVTGVDAAGKKQIAAGATAALGLSVLPGKDRSGETEVTVTVHDGTASASKSFMFKVEGLNDAPVISGIEGNLSMTEDSTQNFSFTVSDADTPAGNITVTVTALPATLIPSDYSNLRVSGFGEERVLTVKPAKDANSDRFGPAKITLTANDNSTPPATVEKVIFVNVAATNDAPAISGTPAAKVNELAEYSFTPTVSDPDDEASALTFSVIGKPAWAVFDTKTGRLSGTPQNKDVGTFTGIVISVTDPQGAASSLNAFDITVVNVNDPPSISDIAVQTTPEDTPIKGIQVEIGDPDGGLVTVALSSAINAALIPNTSEYLNIGSAADNYFGNSYIVNTGTPPNVAAVTLYLKIVPATDKTGIATITVTATDSLNAVTQKNFIVKVDTANDPPVISGLSDQTMNEDATITVSFTVSDDETSASELTIDPPVWTSADMPEMPAGNLVLGGAGANRTLTITPPLNKFGKAVLTLTVKDKHSPEPAAAVKSFALTVNAVNDPPTVTQIANQITTEEKPVEDIPFTVSDPDGGVVEISVTSSDAAIVPDDDEHLRIGYKAGDTDKTYFGRTYKIIDTGELLLKVIPAENKFGIATITVTAKDSSNASATASFIFKVDPVNDPPTVSEILTQTADEDKAVTVNFTIADDETSAAALNVTALWESPFEPKGTLELGGAGANRSLTVTPPEDWSGRAKITVSVKDAGSAETLRTFYLDVKAVNDEPALSGVYSRNTNEDAPIDMTLELSDKEGGPMEISVTSSNTALVPNDSQHINIDGFGTAYILNMLAVETLNPVVTVTPLENKSGTSKLTVTVKDGTLTVTKDMVLTVNSVNDYPVISGIRNQTADANKAVDVAFSVSDAEGGSLQVSVSAETVEASPAGETLIPNDGLHLDIDGYGTSRTITATAGASAGMSLKVTPAANVSGKAQITVTVRDDHNASTQQMFVFTVNYVNDAPKIGLVDFASPAVTNEDTPFDCRFQIMDLEGGMLEITVTSDTETLVPNDYAHISIAEAGPNFARQVNPKEWVSLALKITPLTNKSGMAQITIKVKDGAAEKTETFYLIVNPANDAPVISDIPNQSTKKDTATGSIQFTVTDLEGGLLAGGKVKVSVTSSNKTLVPEDASHISISGFGPLYDVSAGPGEAVKLALVLTPASGKSGDAEITVTVDDGSSSRATAIGTKKFLLMVDRTNAAPTVSGNSNYTMNEDGGTVDIPFTVSDKEGGDMTVSVSSSDIKLVPNDAASVQIADGSGTLFGLNYALSLPIMAVGDDTGTGKNLSLKVMPAADANGQTTLTVTVKDGALTATKAFLLTVSPVNDRPTVSTVSNKITNEETPVTVKFTVSDPETLPDGLTVSAGSSNQAVIPDSKMVLEGSGANYTLTLTPEGSGAANITITVNDNSGDSNAVGTEIFEVTVNPVSHAPVISPIASPRITKENTAITIAFKLSDTDTPVTSLNVTAFSSDTDLIPNANIVKGGSGADRTLTITPAVNKTGTATITIAADDSRETVTAAFTLQVIPDELNSKVPQISGLLSPKITDEDLPIIIDFTVSDSDTPLDQLRISRESLNTVLIPNANAVLGGSGANRRLTVTPAENKSGEAVIRLVVADTDDFSSTAEFTVKVLSVNDTPIISGTTNYTTEKNQTAVIEFAVYDVETSASALAVSAVSSNVSVVPNRNMTLRCFEPSCITRVLTAVPESGQSGQTVITVTVTDDSLAANAAVTKDFYLTVAGVSGSLKGDVDGNGKVELKDAVIALKILAGMPPGAAVMIGADVNNDGKIGVAEVVYILQKVAGKR